MQILKAEVKADILTAAKKEFMQHGFREASLRSIALEAGITVGNIYRYFKNKDSLFRELLAPVIGNIEMMKLGLKQHSNEELNDKDENEEHRRIVIAVYDFIKTHREDLKLLLFKAEGSSMDNYENELISWYSRLYYQNMLKELSDMGVREIEIEETTLYLISKSVADSVKACIEKEMQMEEVMKVANEMFQFYGGGTKQLVLSKLKS